MNKSRYVIVYDDFGKAGLVDQEGRQVVPCIYDKILDYDDDGYIRLLKGDIYGTIDLKGKEVIPHSIGLTHLGVFYDGTARAQKNGLWGLVDEWGEDVTDFCYKVIYAHRKWGYTAIRNNDVKGTLSEDGEFSPTGKTTKYQQIGVYHNGIAPALTWDRKWIFIDKDLKRVNDYEYFMVDTVLRKGLYTVKWDQATFGMAFYDGQPLVEDKFDYPLHFEDGVAVTKKKCLNEKGKEILMNNGQPQYDMGILRENGEYLFPPIYYSIHWNDYKVKDCWFAEDEQAAYLLYPHGVRRVYEKKYVNYTGSLPFIPEQNYSKYINEEALLNKDIPKVIYTHPIRLLDEEKLFADFLNLTDEEVELSDYVYYRDTDVPIPEKSYKEGTIIRCGSDLEVTQRLKRPIHKYRFMVISREIIDANDIRRFHRNGTEHLPFDKYVIHRNDYFLVYDVYVFASVTQIVLLHLPYGLICLAKESELIDAKLKSYVSSEDFSLKKRARGDLVEKMSDFVHGYSLSDKWIEKMKQPIGLDQQLKPVDFEPDALHLFHADTSREVYNLDSYYNFLVENHKNRWQKENFLTDTGRTIQVMVGDINRLLIDAIVEPVKNLPLLKEKEDEPDFIVDVEETPYKTIIRVALPAWHGGDQNEVTQLGRCYDAVLALAAINKQSALAFPCLGVGEEETENFPAEVAAQMTLETVAKHLKDEQYNGNIIFCSPDMERAEVYANLLKGGKIID